MLIFGYAPASCFGAVLVLAPAFGVLVEVTNDCMFELWWERILLFLFFVLDRAKLLGNLVGRGWMVVQDQDGRR